MSPEAQTSGVLLNNVEILTRNAFLKNQFTPPYPQKQKQADLCKFTASMVCKVSSKRARTIT